jgi:hypothetical protein
MAHRGQVADVAEEDEDVLFHRMGRCRCATCLWEKPAVPRADKSKAAASPPGVEPLQLLTLPQYREPRCGYVAPAPVRVTARPKPPPPPPWRWDLFALAFVAAWVIILCISPVGPRPFTWAAGGASGQVPAVGNCQYPEPVEEAPAPVPYCDEPAYGTAAPASGAVYQQQALATSSHSGAQWDRFDTWSV